MRRILQTAFLLISMISFAQEFKPLKTFNGIEISYKVTKTREDEKKVYYVIEFEYVNKSGADYYYKEFNDPDKSDPVNYFAFVENANAKAVSFTSQKYIGLTGDKTKLKTTSNEQIYKIVKNKTYGAKMDFKADKGVEPVIIATGNSKMEFFGSVVDFL